MDFQKKIVEQTDENIRLDKWFFRHYPHISNTLIQKQIRQKDILLNDKKTAANVRLQEGDIIEFPVFEEKPVSKRKISAEEIRLMQDMVIYKDNWVIAINKPAGLAVQGGSKTTRHIDGMLEALQFEKKEKPVLVHRLDKDTSGVLLLERDKNTAAKLAKSFATRQAHKKYWALVYGVPKEKEGKIDAPLIKKSGASGGEQVYVDKENGQSAKTLYRVVDHLDNKAAWLELSPLTGRTHQLRVHCLSMHTPIIGDSKYHENNHLGFLSCENKLHLHAREIQMPHPVKGMLAICAKMPHYMKKSFSELGFDEKTIDERGE